MCLYTSFVFNISTLWLIPSLPALNSELHSLHFFFRGSQELRSLSDILPCFLYFMFQFMASPFSFHCSSSNWYWIVCMVPTGSWGMLLIIWWMVSWRISPKIWIRASKSSWTIWGKLGVSQGYQFLNLSGTSCILSPHESRHCHLHLEEPRT